MSGVVRLLDKGLTLDPNGRQGIEAIHGVGKKTAERLRSQLGLPPERKLTVADFAYAPADVVAAGPNGKLLAQQQCELLAQRISIDGADPQLTAELRARMGRSIDRAVAAFGAEGRPTEWLAKHMASYAASCASRYFIYASEPALASAEEIRAAADMGMKQTPGDVVFTVGAPARGKVVISVDPKTLLAPVLFQNDDNKTEHVFMLARGVKPARGFVLEYPTQARFELEARSQELIDVLASIWAAPQAERASVLAAARTKLDELGELVKKLGGADASLGAVKASTLESIYDVSRQQLNA